MSQFGARNRRQDMSGLVGDLKPAPGADPSFFDGFVSSDTPSGQLAASATAASREGKIVPAQVLFEASFGVKVKKI